jgi:hypothetical protein
MRFILLLLFISACAPKPSKLVFGITSKEELIEVKGEPLEEQTITDKTILVYPEDEKYQVSDGVVESKFRAPSPEEKSLLYWKHQFKDDPDAFTTSYQSKEHADRTIQYFSKRYGLTVVYDEALDQVVRIVEYVPQK